MKRSITWCLSLCFVLGLVGCGNKGALYLPEQPETQKSTQLIDKSSQKQPIEKKQ